MSDISDSPGASGASDVSSAAGVSGASAASGGSGAGASGPRPEPLRFFGTTWVGHDGGYPARRAGVAVGSLAAAAAGCFVLRLAYEGLAIADVGSFVSVLLVVMFAVCSALSFRRTWDGFGRRLDAEAQASLRGLLAIGFLGALLAYFFRCFTEAPGEGLRRTEYEAAREAYERRAARRAGNPSKRSSRQKRRR